MDGVLLPVPFLRVTGAPKPKFTARPEAGLPNLSTWELLA
jgi:hypothetical protein